MALTSAFRVVVWVWLLQAMLSGTAGAQGAEDLAALNRATIAAFAASNLDGALVSGEAAVARAMADPEADPAQHLQALNNLGFLLLQKGAADQRAAALLDDALRLAAASGLEASLDGLLALQNAITVALRLDNRSLALDRLDRFVAQGRASPYHPDVLGVAADFHFQLGRYRQMAGLLEEMVAVGGTIRSATTLDALYTAQTAAEAAGAIEDASALIDARITLVRVLDPALADQFAHGALWTKFYLNQQAGNLGAAADALKDWAATGSMTPAERAFIETQASNSLLYTQLASFSASRAAQLGNAQLALAYAEVLQRPDDPRKGWALRERAAAETGLGQTAAAGQTLHEALAVLEASAEGRTGRYLVLEDLALNAWSQGQPDLADRLFDEADAQYRAAVAGGAAPLSRVDQAIGLNNRARLAAEQGDRARAEALLTDAWHLFRQDQALAPQKRNIRAQEVAFLLTQAGVDDLAGRTDAAIAAARQAVTLGREIWPDPHPEFAMVLSQAADLLARLEGTGIALAYLGEADAINAATLPADTPMALDTKLKRAAMALVEGDRRGAVAELRLAAAGRKSPAFATGLAQASGTFELLTWALLDQPDPGPQDLNDAFTALQWTQVTRSATALAMLQRRLTAKSSALAALIRTAQDLTQESDRTRSRLLATYAGAEDGEAQRAGLRAELAQLDAALATSATALSEAGLEMTGLAAVEPVSLTDLQALLAPDEALVTFVLPGLRPDVVAGLDQSSNFAIAVTRTEVRVARIPQASRGALDRQITAFRCQIALNEPGCATEAGGLQRGAMTLSAPAAATGFDPSVAQTLYADLFGGVETALSGKAQLFIVPPSDLLRLPFQALVTGPVTEGPVTDGPVPWLLRRHAVSVLPSIPSFRTLRGSAGDAASAPALLGVGDPVLGAAAPVDCAGLGLATLRSGLFRPSGNAAEMTTLADPARLRSLPGLPDASCEVRAIASAFPQAATVLLQGDATETRLKDMNDAARLAQFDTLVFATHGLLAGEAGAPEPGLVLTPPATASDRDDGLLTASEIATLTLNARLVLLSACSTASGDSGDRDGLAGLARAFFQAGARTLMVTHWSVYSSAATRVSTGLIRTSVAEPGLPPSRALRQTLLDIIDDPGGGSLQKHPSYWAAFAIVGAD